MYMLLILQRSFIPFAVAALALLLASCTPPTPAVVAGTSTPTLPLGIFWSGGGWNVERYFVADDAPPSYYCVATTGTPGNILGIMEVPGGMLAWGVSSPAITATSGGQAELAFQPGSTLPFDVAPGTAGYLVSVNPASDAGRQEKLARALRQAGSVTVTANQIGRLGRFVLTGSSAALDQLDLCAKGGG